MGLKKIFLLSVLVIAVLLYGCDNKDNVGRDIASEKKTVRFNVIYDGYLTSESGKDRPDDVVFCFTDTMKWEEFRMKYLKNIDIPRIEPDTYNKVLLCICTLQAIPYKISQSYVQEIFSDESQNYIVLDPTGVVEESDSVWISQIIILTVDADDFDRNLPINVVID